jgi:hypothetical protein
MGEGREVNGAATTKVRGVVRVTRAQRRAAEILVELDKRADRPTDPAVAAIAKAKPRRGLQRPA